MPRRKPRFPQRGDVVELDGTVHRVVHANYVDGHKRRDWRFQIACDPRDIRHIVPFDLQRTGKPVDCVLCLVKETENPGEW